LVIIIVVAALVLGPKRLPGVARRAGQTLRSAQKAKSELQEGLDLTGASKVGSTPAAPVAAPPVSDAVPPPPPAPARLPADPLHPGSTPR
jgi:TatA/E family protein of Tat protein translocase